MHQSIDICTGWGQGAGVPNRLPRAHVCFGWTEARQDIQACRALGFFRTNTHARPRARAIHAPPPQLLLDAPTLDRQKFSRRFARTLLFPRTLFAILSPYPPYHHVLLRTRALRASFLIVLFPFFPPTNLFFFFLLSIRRLARDSPRLLHRYQTRIFTRRTCRRPLPAVYNKIMLPVAYPVKRRSSLPTYVTLPRSMLRTALSAGGF